MSGFFLRIHGIVPCFLTQVLQPWVQENESGVLYFHKDYYYRRHYRLISTLLTRVYNDALMPIFHKCYNMLNQNPKIKKLRQLWRWDCYEIVKIFCVRAARKWVEVMQFIELLPPYFMTWRHHLSVWTDILAYFLYQGGKIQNKNMPTFMLIGLLSTYIHRCTYTHVIGYYNSFTICWWQYQWKNSNWCVPWQQWFIWHKNLY